MAKYVQFNYLLPTGEYRESLPIKVDDFSDCSIDEARASLLNPDQDGIVLRDEQGLPTTLIAKIVGIDVEYLEDDK